MIRLTCFELYKIVSRRSVRIAVAAMLTVFVLYSFIGHPGSLDGAKAYQPYEGAITAEKAALSTDKLSGGYSQRDQTEYGVFYDILYFAPDEWKHSISKRMDSAGNELKPTVTVSDIQYNKPWAYLIEYIDQFGVVFMLGILLLGLGPVFAEEYSKGTAGLIRSSKRGKRQVVSAKLLASAVYICLCAILFSIVNLVVYGLRFGHLAGADTPLQSLAMYFNTFDFEYSPYALTAGQFYLYQFLTFLAGSLLFGCVVLFISVLSSSPVTPMLVGAVMLGGPYLIEFYGFTSHWDEYVRHFAFSAAIRATSFFNAPRSYAVFGLEFPYWQIYASVMGIVAIGVVAGTYRVFRGREELV